MITVGEMWQCKIKIDFLFYRLPPIPTACIFVGLKNTQNCLGRCARTFSAAAEDKKSKHDPASIEFQHFNRYAGNLGADLVELHITNMAQQRVSAKIASLRDLPSIHTPKTGCGLDPGRLEWRGT